MAKLYIHPKADLRELDDLTWWAARDLDDPTIAWSFGMHEGAWNDRRPMPIDEFEALSKRHTGNEAWQSGWPGARPPPKKPKLKPEKKAPRGRPPIEGISRPVKYSIGFTWDEASAIVEHAKGSGTTISVVIRALIVEGLAASKRRGAREAKAAAATPAEKLPREEPSPPKEPVEEIRREEPHEFHRAIPDLP